jgi:hypothetical protein
MKLGWSNTSSLEQMAQHVGIRRRCDGVVLILIIGYQIAQTIQVPLLALIEFALGQQVIHDCLRSDQMLLGSN